MNFTSNEFTELARRIKTGWKRSGRRRAIQQAGKKIA
jgi:hypothetical protein